MEKEKLDLLAKVYSYTVDLQRRYGESTNNRHLDTLPIMSQVIQPLCPAVVEKLIRYRMGNDDFHGTAYTNVSLKKCPDNAKLIMLTSICTRIGDFMFAEASGREISNETIKRVVLEIMNTYVVFDRFSRELPTVDELVAKITAMPRQDYEPMYSDYYRQFMRVNESTGMTLDEYTQSIAKYYTILFDEYQKLCVEVDEVAKKSRLSSCGTIEDFEKLLDCLTDYTIPIATRAKNELVDQRSRRVQTMIELDISKDISENKSLYESIVSNPIFERVYERSRYYYNGITRYGKKATHSLELLSTSSKPLFVHLIHTELQKPESILSEEEKAFFKKHLKLLTTKGMSILEYRALTRTRSADKKRELLLAHIDMLDLFKFEKTEKENERRQRELEKASGEVGGMSSRDHFLIGIKEIEFIANALDVGLKARTSADYAYKLSEVDFLNICYHKPETLLKMLTGLMRGDSYKKYGLKVTKSMLYKTRTFLSEIRDNLQSKPIMTTMSFSVDGKLREVTPEEHEIILEYIREHKLPINERIYNVLARRLLIGGDVSSKFGPLVISDEYRQTEVDDKTIDDLDLTNEAD